MIRLTLVVSLLFAAPIHAYDFSASAIRAHMNFLASDLLEGRGAGTRGHDIAASYVAAQFEAAGVAPGAGAGYYQVIPFQKTVADPQSAITLIPDDGSALLLKFGDGFVTTGDPLHADRTVQGRVVVVGYGITAPDLQHDDYAGIDARGKIVVLFSGAPSRFGGAVRAHYSSSANKIENAAAHGAVAVMVLSMREQPRPGSWARSVRQAQLGAMHWLDAAGTARGITPEISGSISLNPEFADSIFGRGGRTLAKTTEAVKSGKFRSFDLPMRASIRTISRHERIDSPNVVGLVRGSDETLRDEYLVYTSHLDHLGITEAVKGDTINNGAVDNASGIAALLEIARAMAAQNPPPRRSVLFVATTAEEKGLRGADYFAINPTVPQASVVANINIDQIAMTDAVRDVVAHGADASTLGEVVRRVASETGIEISEDAFPEQVFFVRSDQYPFVKQGIPALYIDPGYKAVDPKTDAKKVQGDWMRARYHSPSDDLSQKLDFTVPAMLARFDFLVGLEVANAQQRPSWLPGNFFGLKFARKRE